MRRRAPHSLLGAIFILCQHLLILGHVFLKMSDPHKASSSASVPPSCCSALPCGLSEIYACLLFALRLAGDCGVLARPLHFPLSGSHPSLKMACSLVSLCPHRCRSSPLTLNCDRALSTASPVHFPLILCSANQRSFFHACVPEVFHTPFVSAF